MSILRSKANKAGESVFKLDISNTLGIDALEARAKLKKFALEKPSEYADMRNQVYIDVVKAMVEGAHETIWNLLANGIKPDKKPIEVNGSPWSPALPDQQIATHANGFAESMMDAFEKIMDKVLPDDYRQLAEEKQVNIGKVNSVLKP